jgi:hypothetical protein
MARGNSVVTIKVYGRRDAVVPFLASLLAFLMCLNVGLAAFREFVWVLFLVWAAFTAYIAGNFLESWCIPVHGSGKSGSMIFGRERIPISDITSIGKTSLAGFGDVFSLRRVKVKVTMRDGNVHYFPLPLTPSIADRVDGLVAELSKHTKAAKKR